MLDSIVAMLQTLFTLLLLFFQDAPIGIVSPQPGATLRGQVNIAGNLAVANFSSAELAFAYASDPTSTWFIIQNFSFPILDTALATWDTTTLTDGGYILRLRVYLQDGSMQEAFVPDLKLRNDIPVSLETSTPQADSVSVPTFPASTPVPATVAPTFAPLTPLPVNPASLSEPSIYLNFARGALLALGIFFIMGVFFRIRRT